MNYGQARQILLEDTLEEGGAFTRLRLGENPGTQRMRRLRVALRVLWKDLAGNDTVPREIAFTCGMIIAFKDECIGNARRRPRSRGEAAGEWEPLIDDLAQGAFDVLAGQAAEAWVIPRPDLENHEDDN